MKPEALKEISIYKIWVTGFEGPLWATERQAMFIIECANKPETRQNLLKLGNFVFKASSVSRMKQIETQRYNIPSYATQRYDEEINGLKIF